MQVMLRVSVTNWLNTSKGVVAVVYPDECMPVDDFGFRADVMMNSFSVVDRNNPGQFYECAINRIGEFVRRKAHAAHAVGGWQAAYAICMEWSSDVNEKSAALIAASHQTDQDKKAWVEDCLSDFPRLHIPPFLNTLCPAPEDAWNALRNVGKWARKWEVKGSPITYQVPQGDGTFKTVRSEAEFNMGSKYWILLNKLADIAAPGPSAVNHLGIPTKTNFSNQSFPVGNNPYRYGEDEMRVISMDADPREVFRLLCLMANSPSAMITACESIIRSKHSTRIRRIPVTNARLAQTSMPLRMFHNSATCLGVQTKNTKIDMMEVSDDLIGAISDIDEGTEDKGGVVISAVEKREKIIRTAKDKQQRLDNFFMSMIEDDGTKDVDGLTPEYPEVDSDDEEDDDESAIPEDDSNDESDDVVDEDCDEASDDDDD